MTRYFLRIAKIVGTATETKGSWVHTFFPLQEEKISGRGQLLAVLSLSRLVEGIEITGAGKEIISRLHEEYYGDLQNSPFEQLKQAVERVAAEVAGQFEIEITAMSVVDRVFYAALIGKGRLIICRGGKVTNLLVGTGETKESPAAGSGYLQNNDLFLLGTGELFNLVAEGVLQAALSGGLAEEAAESLAPIIHGQEDGGKAAAIIAKAQERRIAAAITDEPSEEYKTEEPEKEKPNFLPRPQWVRKIKGRFILIKDGFGKRIFGLFQKAEKRQGPSRTAITVAIILLFILGISVVLGSRQKERLGLGQRTEALLKEARLKKEEGEALLGLNPNKARELFSQAQGLVNQIETGGAQNPELVGLKEELGQLLTKVTKEHKVQGALFFDLELLKAQATGEEIVSSDRQLAILDKNKAAVYGLDPSNKKSTILSGGEDLRGAKTLAFLGGKIYVLTAGGIWDNQLKIRKDPDWEEILAMAGFSGSLYLLDKKGEIWKYSATASGFGPKQKWLKETADFPQAVSLAIDGTIWVLKSDGKIWRFNRGTKEAFGLTGLTRLFSSPIKIYTEPDLEDLYILDRGNSRLVIMKKTGEYDSEYRWEGIGQANGMVITDGGKRAYFLLRSKIFFVDLK